MRIETGSRRAFNERKANAIVFFLIDDFASELDQYKRALLAERLQQSGSQVFVTAITQEQLKEMQVKNRKMFSVDNGIIKTLD